MSERYERGVAAIEELYGEVGQTFFDRLEAIAPDFGRFIIEFSYGEVFTRPGLNPCSRELVVIGALAALGTAEEQLKAHVRGALQAGATQTEIVEAIMQVAVYAGFPAGFNALMAAKDVFEADA